MRSLNQVQIIGNLGQDPDLKTIPSGNKVLSMSVATSESFKKGNEWETRTEWHRATAWGDLAERMHRDLKKGDRVYLSGKITTRSWDDPSGQKRYATEIVVREYIPIDKKSQSSSSTREPAEEQRAPQPTYEDEVPF